MVSGCGVGGGSLGYANTLYRPRDGSAFYRDPQWGELEDWETALRPHYDTAERMLGVTTYEGEGPADTLLRELATEMGVPETYSTTRVGVFFGEPGETVADPYFGGDGPPRAGCIRCGACMVGCRHNAKNTLVKNYLWFAERNGVQVLPERTVAEIRPLGAPDGSDGYAVTSEYSGAWFRKDRQVLTARGVVVAAGALGTNQLLQRCRLRRLAAAALGPHRPRRPHQQRGDHRRHHQGRPPRLHQVDRDHLELLSRPRHPHRERHLRPRRRLDLAPLHDPHRRRHVPHAPAEAAGRGAPPPARVRAHPVAAPVVAAHGDHPRDADARQLDPAAPEAQPARPRAAPADPGGPGQAQPALRRGRRPRDPPRGREVRRDAAVGPHGGAAEHPHHRAHHGRRRDRRAPGDRRGRRPPARLRLREPARLRRRGDPGQHRGQPEPHDHGDGRARHEPHPGPRAADRPGRHRHGRRHR